MERSNDIEMKTKKYLQDASTIFLEDIISHGIHNLTNDFNGRYYSAYESEFKKRAKLLLEAANTKNQS